MSFGTRAPRHRGSVFCLFALLALVAACSASSKSPLNAKMSSTTMSAGAAAPSVSGAPSTPLGVTWMDSFAAPGTPARFNKVGVIKVGPASAKNVLVLEPGTSIGSAYFVPLAQWIVSSLSGWQVWSVERRENLIEDQSELNSLKAGNTTAAQLYDYYLGFLKNPAVEHHIQLIPSSTVAFAKQWGINVAVEDLRQVIEVARSLGGKVVLGGHSLGGSVVTAYATWDFNGRAGADDLAGLVYIDGGSFRNPISAQQANSELQTLNAPNTSPWLFQRGIPAPFAGVFDAVASAAALLDPNGPSLAQMSGLLPAAIVPRVPVTNVGLYGYAFAADAHLGIGVATPGPIHGWDGAGALTPLRRYATMFAGASMQDVDGTEWYFPQRLTDDTGAVGTGTDNPAQHVLDLHATMGHRLPRSLLIYAFGAQAYGVAVLHGAQTLSEQSQIPASNLTLVDRQSTYAHNDPAGAYPNNDFLDQLISFLDKISSHA